MADAPAKAKAGLTRKVGPLPLWAWVAGGLVVGYLLYKHFAGTLGASSGAQVQEQQTSAATPDSSMGIAPSAGAPADTGQTTSDYITALGGQQSSLLAAVEQANQDIVGLAQSQISYAQTQTSLGSFSTQTQPVASQAPGGSNAPVIDYVMPQVVTTPAQMPAAATPSKAKQTAAATRYYTYKRDVPLGKNQTVHFTAGRGYYAYG